MFFKILLQFPFVWWILKLFLLNKIIKEKTKIKNVPAIVNYHVTADELRIDNAEHVTRHSKHAQG